MEVDKRIAYIVHANWNKAQKKSRMVRDNLWFADRDDGHCVQHTSTPQHHAQYMYLCQDPCGRCLVIMR